MGQKINPLGFRLGITQNHRSYWFAKPKKYSKVFEEDKKIRDCIELYVQKHIKNSSNYGGIARVEIKRKTDLIQVEIYTGFPALLVESRGQGIEQLKLNVQNILSSEDRKLLVLNGHEKVEFLYKQYEHELTIVITQLKQFTEY
ncbi:hypothetical protein Mapa_018217 [Marchantia paleacea]|nr:hypothetical protein Mapa_018217 [Marchantia paleacea]